MTKVNPSNGNETKSDIFPWDIFKSDTISFFYQKILKYFNDFQNRNFSVLFGHKILKYFNEIIF